MTDPEANKSFSDQEVFCVKRRVHYCHRKIGGPHWEERLEARRPLTSREPDFVLWNSE